MSNPFAAPANNNSSDDIGVRIPEGRSWVVVSDYLYCRQNLDLSDFCYWTGGRELIGIKNSAITCWPKNWRFGTSACFVVISIIMILTGMAGVNTRYFGTGFWIIVSFSMAAVSLRLSKVPAQLGLSQQGRKVPWIRFMKMLVFVALWLTALTILETLQWQGQLPQLLDQVNFETLGLGLGLAILVVWKFGKTVSATEIADGVFRIQGLPSALRESLRRFQQEVSNS